LLPQQQPRTLSRRPLSGQKRSFNFFAVPKTGTLPADLKHFIADHGLFEEFTRNDSQGYVELWAVEDIIEENQAIEMGVHAPGFLAFAGNGGGEVF
jgi:hypothetical protein